MRGGGSSNVLVENNGCDSQRPDERYLLAGAPRRFGYEVAGLIAGLSGLRGPPPWMAGA